VTIGISRRDYEIFITRRIIDKGMRVDNTHINKDAYFCYARDKIIMSLCLANDIH